MNPETTDVDLAALLRPELADLTAYVPAERPGIEVRLDANEPPRAESSVIREVVLRAVAGVALERYPDARGRVLKQRIAERMGTKPGEIFLGSGSDEVIALLVNALARPRGRGFPVAGVMAPSPTFVMYRITARAHGLRPIEVPLDEGWDLDVGAMKRAIEVLCPNVIFIASPNNPTGNLMSDDRLKAVLEAAKGAFVVLDEAYADYAGESRRAWRARYSNLGILRTLSKVGLAALRIGWLEADEALVAELDKSRQPFNVNAVSQAAAAAVLADAWEEVGAEVKRVTSERARLDEALTALGIEVTPSAANFLWVKTPRPAEEVFRTLAERGVLVKSFHAGGGRLAHQLRITVGSPHENDRLLEALRACV